MNHFKKTLLKSSSTKTITIFLGLLIFIGMMGSLTIDMYVPSLPAIAKTFSVSATAVKYTLTIYLISYAVGQLFFGPFIDCFGRKRVLLIAITVGSMGSLLCLFSHSIIDLYIGRFLQGAGYAAIGAAAPAIARDILNDKQFAQAGSILSLVFGLGPVIAPILGSYIDFYFGWRIVFTVISIYSILAILVIIFLIPETLTKEKRRIFRLRVILNTYATIIKNKVFIKNTLSKSAAYMGFIVFYTVTPFMLQDHLGLTSVEYGWITLILTGTILFAKFANTVLLNYIDINQLILYSTIALMLASLLLLAFALFHEYSLIAIVLPFTLFGLGSGFLFSNTTVAAFFPFKNMASGSVSGLLNGIQLLAAFVGSALAAHLSLLSLMPLAIFMTVVCAVALSQYLFFSRIT